MQAANCPLPRSRQASATGERRDAVQATAPQRSCTIRRLRPDDSIEALTAMLCRAFTGLGASGMNCSCVDQTPDTTRQRIGRGECLVALDGERIVGTVTLETADPASPIAWYRHPSVASLHQLAVEPCRQGAGIGQALLHAAEAWAFRQRCCTLALDTPEPARHLHAFYARHGFGCQGTVQLAGRTYRSVVFGKPVRRHPHTARAVDVAWPARHPAELALLRLRDAPHSRDAACAIHRSEALSSAAIGRRGQLR